MIRKYTEQRRVKTLKEFNDSRLLAYDIMSGKKYRNKRRKDKNKKPVKCNL